MEISNHQVSYIVGSNRQDFLLDIVAVVALVMAHRSGGYKSIDYTNFIQTYVFTCKITMSFRKLNTNDCNPKTLLQVPITIS